MNSIALAEQTIFTRDNAIFGSQIFTLNYASAGEKDTLDSVIPDESLFDIVLKKVETLYLNDIGKFKGIRAPADNRFFLAIEEQVLLKHNIIDDLGRAATFLAAQHMALVVIIRRSPTRILSAKQRIILLGQLFDLKEKNIELCLNIDNLDISSTFTLLHLDAFDYITIKASNELNTNTHITVHQRTVTRRTTLSISNETNADLLVTHVRNASEDDLFRGLPIRYFQGDYYSPPAMIECKP